MSDFEQPSNVADTPKTLTQAPPVPENHWKTGLPLTISVIFLCLLGGELGSRYWFPLPAIFAQPDARYLFTYIPNSRRYNFRLPGTDAPKVLITINSQGRRGRTFSDSRAYRVIVYGDSFIAAENTPLSQTFVCQLEQSLTARLSQPVEVVNAAVPGYGPDQESLVMEDEIDTVKPNLVIVALYSGNDFGDLLRNKLYKLDGDKQLIAGHPKLDASLIRQFETGRRRSHFQLIRRAQILLGKEFRAPRQTPVDDDLNHTALLRLWLAEREQEYRNYVLKNDDHVYNLFADTYDGDVSLTPRSESSVYKRILMDRVIERIQRIASSRSVPLVFLIIPAALDELEHWYVSVDPAHFSEYRRSELTDVLESIARKQHLLYINLFEPFRRHQAAKLYHLVGDEHWNAAGQQLAANLMADYVVRNHLLWTTR
jgi:hypothetical protein